MGDIIFSNEQLMSRFSSYSILKTMGSKDHILHNLSCMKEGL
jgi:hypothetical protein